MPQSLSVYIVDDEPLARMRLAALVRESVEPVCTVAGEAGSAAEALEGLSSAHGPGCDVVLLDIQMPGANGLKLAEGLKRLTHVPHPPAVVFVTAHADHALQAFDLEAVDYLTKPVRRDRLQQALARVAARRPGPDRAVPADTETPVLVVTERGRIVRIPVTEVLYLKAELKYVTLRTATHAYVLDDSLTDLEPRLGDRFIRLHRNALVARAAVRSLERRALPGEGDEGGDTSWAVQVAPVGEWLAVSRRQLAAVREAIATVGV